MKLPYGLNAPAIRVLQEYRRLGATSMNLEAIRAIKHPAPVGDEVVEELTRTGLLEPGETSDQYKLTDHGTSFLGKNPEP